MTKNKKNVENVIQIISLILLLLTAGFTAWNSYETKKMADIMREEYLFTNRPIISKVSDYFIPIDENTKQLVLIVKNFGLLPAQIKEITVFYGSETNLRTFEIEREIAPNQEEEIPLNIYQDLHSNIQLFKVRIRYEIAHLTNTKKYEYNVTFENEQTMITVGNE